MWDKRHGDQQIVDPCTVLVILLYPARHDVMFTILLYKLYSVETDHPLGIITYGVW